MIYTSFAATDGTTYDCAACTPWAGYHYVPRPDGTTLSQWIQACRDVIPTLTQAPWIQYKVYVSAYGPEVQRRTICDFHLPHWSQHETA